MFFLRKRAGVIAPKKTDSPNSIVTTNSNDQTEPIDDEWRQANYYFRDHSHERIFFPQSERVFSRITVLPQGSELPAIFDATTLVLQELNGFTPDSPSRFKPYYIRSSDTGITSSTPRDKSKLIHSNLGELIDSSSKTENSLSRHDSDLLASLFGIKKPASLDLEGTYIQLANKKIYHIERLIGEGGYSKVYLAYTQDKMENCVFKVNVLTDNHCTALKQEEKICNKLGLLYSPGFSIQYNDQNFYSIPMTYISGEQLSVYLTQHPNLNFETRINLALELCWAVHTLHQTGIAHGDLKPENIIITKEGELKLVDYGCSSKNLDSVEEYESTATYKLPHEFSLTRKQSDIIALMRCLMHEEILLTAHDKLYTKRERTERDGDVAIFDADFNADSVLKEQLISLLSTSCLHIKNINDAEEKKQKIEEFKKVLPQSTMMLIERLIHFFCLQNPNEYIERYLHAALDLEKRNHLKNSGLLEYINKQKMKKHYENDYAKITDLLQAMRIITHGLYAPKKIDKIYKNPYFIKALELSGFTDIKKDLEKILLSRNPQDIKLSDGNIYTIKTFAAYFPENVSLLLSEFGINGTYKEQSTQTYSPSAKLIATFPIVPAPIISKTSPG